MYSGTVLLNWKTKVYTYYNKQTGLALCMQHTIKSTFCTHLQSESSLELYQLRAEGTMCAAEGDGLHGTTELRYQL